MKTATCVLLLIHFIRQTQSIIVEPSPDVNVSYGKPMYFNCTCSTGWKAVVLRVPGEIGFKFAIFNGGSCQVPFEKRTHFSVGCYGDKTKFGILQPVDNTTWQCLCSYHDNTDETMNTRVNRIPELPSISPQKQTYVVKEGEDASLSCHFTGAPILNVTWIHNNKALKWSTTNQPYLLNFQNVSRAATGNYTCEVTVNYKGTYTASETFNLVVLYPPTLKSGNDTTEIEGIAMVTLTCEIAEHGNPANYSNPHWQHWIGDILIRNLSSNSLMTTQGFSLILKSVTIYDSGRYVCLISNGVPDYSGNWEQSDDTELTIQGIPRILQTQKEYYAQVGKVFRIKHECVGIPETSSFGIEKNNTLSELLLYNTTETIKFVNVHVYDTTVEMSGRSLETNFGTVKDRFKSSFQLIATNSIGTAKQTLFVEAHEFPSEPFHIHIEKYSSHILVEWEGAILDSDIIYELLIKNYSGDDKIFRYPGSNSKIYKTNLTINGDIIIQICTTNVLGKNCSSTFKVKRGNKPKYEAALSNEMSKTTWVTLVVFGAIGFLNILACAVFLTSRKRKITRKSSTLSSLKRHNYSLERNNYALHRVDSKDQRKDYSGNTNPTFETYLTPDSMTSQKAGLSQQFSMDGNEYASVDDPAILKMRPKRRHHNGLYDMNRNSNGKAEVPNLPARPNQDENAYLTTESAPHGEEWENDATINSSGSPSLLLEMASETGDENREITQYLTCMTENEKETLKNSDWWTH
nr:uncharacterized protein LOC111127656 isoform X3 [Crassostrea virginica]